MSLRFKILSGFLILSAMLFVAGAWSIHEVSSIGGSVQKILDDNYRSINAAKTMIESLERQDSGVLLLLLGRWDQGRSIIDSADRMFLHAFDLARNNITEPGEQAQIEDVQQKYKHYKDLWLKPIAGTRFQGDLNWYSERIHQAFLEAKASVDKLMALNDRSMYQTASRLKERAHRATMPGVVAILAALLFSLVFNYFIHIYVVNPILAITRGIQKFLETKEPFQVQVETRDEIGRLATSMADLLAQIRVGREPR